MKNTLLKRFASCLVLFITSFLLKAETGSYGLVVEGFDWGPSASRVILEAATLEERPVAIDFTVRVFRSVEGLELAPAHSNGEREVLLVYPSDRNGVRTEDGDHWTLVLSSHPEDVLGSPMLYLVLDGRGGNQWINYRLEVKQNSTGQVWNREDRRIRPIVDDFELDGIYEHSDGIRLSYAWFEPKNKQTRHPLIIWLHGGREGGTDPSTVLMANRAAQYAAEEVQVLFGGAYVLAPQAPTRWMHGVSGGVTWGQERDIYAEALKGLFDQILSEHPGIDVNRIYVGGCSNGGYMALRLLMDHPDFFAASFISALAFGAEHIDEDDLMRIASTPVWFVHTAHDPTTPAEQTVLPLYHRLVGAGASSVHLSLYENVFDITGLFGGRDYRYHDHFSWIFHHANHCRIDFDGNPVLVDGRPVAILDWLAAQRLGKQ